MMSWRNASTRSVVIDPKVIPAVPTHGTACVIASATQLASSAMTRPYSPVTS